jgi:hypothetical protein
MSEAARLTFNFPALRYFFSEEGVVGIRIKVSENTVYIRPSWTATSLPGVSPTLEMVARGNRGKQVIIDDEDVLTALAINGIEEYPYFVLKQDKQGWIRLDHHADEEAPRTIPHVRLWTERDAETAREIATPKEVSMPETAEDFGTMITTFVGAIQESHSIVVRHLTQRRVGRPPMRVQQAKSVLTTFERIYRNLEVQKAA